MEGLQVKYVGYSKKRFNEHCKSQIDNLQYQSMFWFQATCYNSIVNYSSKKNQNSYVFHNYLQGPNVDVSNGMTSLRLW